jgi:acylphosphatase
VSTAPPAAGSLPERAVHGYVSGRVQGVYYRASFVQACQEQSLTGWVRNLDDGRVEFFVQGANSAVEAALAWARQGPPAARVDRLEAHPVAPQPEWASMAVRRG